MTGISQYLPVIACNVNNLSSPVRRLRLAEWTEKQNPFVCCIQENHLNLKDIYRLKIKEWKTIFMFQDSVCQQMWQFYS